MPGELHDQLPHEYTPDVNHSHWKEVSDCFIENVAIYKLHYGSFGTRVFFSRYDVILPFSRYSGCSRIKDMESFLDFLVSSLVFLTMAVMQHEIVRCCNAQDFHRFTTVAINCTSDFFCFKCAPFTFDCCKIRLRESQVQVRS